MAKEEADRSPLRELARQEPAAVRAVARRADDRLEAWLKRILEEEAES